MTFIRIEWDQQSLDRVFNSPTGPVAKDLLQRGARVEARAKLLCTNQLVNVQTGRLRSSITHLLGTENGQMVCFVGTNVEYALPVHEGHKEFDIVAPAGKTLRWVNASGEVMFRKRVHIPATHPRPFLRNALSAAL